MTRSIRMATLAAALTVVGSSLLTAWPALAQGPYGRNSYADFPYNQGSLFYRPLKPQPRPKPKVSRPAASAPRTPATTYTARQPYMAPQQPRYYYYYPGYSR